MRFYNRVPYRVPEDGPERRKTPPWLRQLKEWSAVVLLVLFFSGQADDVFRIIRSLTLRPSLLGDRDWLFRSASPILFSLLGICMVVAFIGGDAAFP